MRKIVFFISVLALSNLSYAQLSKGKFMLGGSFNYSQYSNTNKDSLTYSSSSVNKNTRWNAILNFGYFISDKIVIGITGGYQNFLWNSRYVNGVAPNSSSGDNNQTSNSFSGGVFVRYYKMIDKSKFGFFGQLSASYGAGNNSTKQVYTDNTGSTIQNVDGHGTSTVFNAGLNPGIVYFISNKVGIETSFGMVGYSIQDTKNYSKYNQTGNGTVSGLYANFTMSSLYFGINYYFGGKKTESKDVQK